jgi:hypothetical protein
MMIALMCVAETRFVYDYGSNGHYRQLGYLGLQDKNDVFKVIIGMPVFEKQKCNN